MRVAETESAAGAAPGGDSIRLLVAAGAEEGGRAIARAAGLDRAPRIVLGAGAADAAVRERWDLVIVEIADEDAFALLQRLSPLAMRVIATGRSVSVEAAVRAMQLGADDCAPLSGLRAACERQLATLHDREEPPPWWGSDVARLIGLTADGPLDVEQILDSVHPDDRARVRRAEGEAKLSGRFHEQFRVVGADGEIRQIDGWGVSRSGAPLLVGMAQDITERRVMEEVLIESEQRYRGIIETMGEGVLLFESSGLVTCANRAIGSILGVPPALLVGRHLVEVNTSIARAWETERSGRGQRGVKVECELLSASGEERWGIVTVTTIASPGGDSGGVAIVSDITDRRRVEQKLREAQWIARMGSWDYDLAEGELRFSESISPLFGLDAQPAGSWRSLLDLVPPSDRQSVRESVLTAFEKGSLRFETALHREGRRIEVEVTGVLRMAADGTPTGLFGTIQDVTESKKAALALAQSRQALAEAHRIAQLTQWRMDIGLDLVEVSPSAGWRLGSGRFSTQQILQVVAPPDRRRVAEALAAAINGAPYNIEYRMETPAGEAIVHAVGELRRDASGYPREIVGTIQDITEIRATQEALFRTQQEFGAIIEGVPDAIARFDRTLRAVYLNAAFATVHGVAIDVLLGRSLEDPSAEALVGRTFTDAIRTVMASGESASLEMVNGEAPAIRHLQTRIVPQFDREGAVEAVLSISRDVTSLAAAAAERERMRRKLDLLLQSTWEGILATDATGSVTLANPAALRLLGLELSSVLGRPPHELLHPFCRSEGGVCALRVALEAAQPIRLPDERLQQGDSRFDAQVAVSPMIDSGVFGGLVVSFSDVSEQKLLETELERADRLSSLGRVAATMAHEFNNVLMGIQPFGEIIQRQAKDEATVTAAAHITRAIERGRNITHEILRFTRPSPPDRKPVDATPLLCGIEERLRALMPPGIRLQIESEPGVLLWADRAQVEQAVTNLALNARDAMAGSGVLRISITRCLSGEVYSFGVVPTSDRFAHVTVSDTGEGIDETTLKQIFDPFFTTKREGTGLGLPVVHQIVRNHGGHVFAESELKRGTTFHLFFPLAHAPEEVSAQSQPSRGAAGAVEILLVEDEESVAAGIVALLEGEGASVAVAGTGGEAVEILRSRSFEAAILDIGLPDMSGLELFEAIERLRPTLPVIFSTGHGDETQVESVTHRSDVAFLMKPYDFETLLSTLTRITTPDR